LKKEIIYKERKINELNLTIDSLKNQNINLKSKANNESLEKIAKESADSPKSPKEFYFDNFISDKSNENFISNVNVSNVQKCKEMKNILEENEFLNRKYRKYQIKYIKFKAKYSEMKNMISIISSGSSIGLIKNKSSRRSSSTSSIQEKKKDDCENFFIGSKRKSQNSPEFIANSKNQEIKVHKEVKSPTSNDEKFQKKNSFFKKKEENKKHVKKTKNTKKEKVVQEVNTNSNQVETDDAQIVAIENCEDVGSAQINSQPINTNDVKSITLKLTDFNKQKSCEINGKKEVSQKLLNFFENTNKNIEEKGKNVINYENNQVTTRLSKIKSNDSIANITSNNSNDNHKKAEKALEFSYEKMLLEANKNVIQNTDPKKQPIPREKKQIENVILKKQELYNKFIDFINSIKIEDDLEGTLVHFISNFRTSHSNFENISKIFEIIIESISELDFIKLLFFLKTYFTMNQDFSKQFKYITEILEQNHNTILSKSTMLLVKVDDDNSRQLYDMIFKEDRYNLKNILLQLIQALNKSSYIIAYFISFFIIISIQNNDRKEADFVNIFINCYKTLIEIFFHNSVINENLFIIKSLTNSILNTTEYDLLNKIDTNFLMEIENVKCSNNNKIMYFESFAKNSINSKTINFINQVIDISSGMTYQKITTSDITNIPNQITNTLDAFLIETIETYFRQINSETILNENLSDKISFIDEQGYVDLYQTIFLISKIKVK